MKKMLAFLLAICILFTIGACNGDPVENNEASDVHTHTFAQVGEPILCDKGGTRIMQCQCGAQQTEEVLPKEHTFGEWIVDTEVTVEVEGLKRRICQICGYEETEVVPQYVAIYNSLIEDYKKIAKYVVSNDVRDDLGNGKKIKFGLSDVFKMVDKHPDSTALQFSFTIEDGFRSSGFATLIYDINADEIPELFWLCGDNNDIFAIFTVVNNKPVLVDSYMYASDACMTDDGKNLYYYRNDVEDWGYKILTLSSKGKWVAQEIVGYSYERECEYGSGYYHKKGSKIKTLSEEQFQKIVNTKNFTGEFWENAEIQPLEID